MAIPAKKGIDVEDFPHQVRLDYSEDKQVAWLRFESEHRANVFTIGMLRDLLAAVEELRDGKQPRVLVIAGRDNVFSGGADLRSIQAMSDDDYKTYIETEYKLFALIDTLPFATVAMLTGACIGNGAELALACDFRIASDTTRFGMPEMAVGFIAPTQRIARFLPLGRAKDFLFGSKLLDATSALELGLFTTVVPSDVLVAETEKAAAKYATIAPIALRLTKQGLQRSYRSICIR